MYGNRACYYTIFGIEGMKMDKNDFIFYLAIAIIVILLITGIICSRDVRGIKGVKILPIPIGSKIMPIMLWR